MPANRRATSSLSTLHIVAVVGVVVTIGIVLAVLLAPRKPPPPPDSRISYENRPDADTNPADDGWGAFRPRNSGRDGSTANSNAAGDEPELSIEEAPYVLSGSVIDSRSMENLPDARITAQRIWSDAEEADWNRRRDAARDAGGDTVALEKEQRRLQFIARGVSDEQGAYQLAIGEAGQYRVDARVRGYIDNAVSAPPLNEETPQVTLRIELSTGAQVAGRVTEEGSSRGAPGLRVFLEEQPGNFGITDEQGNYVVSGLRPGNFGVLVNLAETEYRIGKKIPYERVNIRDADQQLNVNFTVEAAGVVWGYVMTPNNQPVPASEVVLASSESVLTQALTAMIKQAPPIRDRSDEEGYYELLGIPLNQEWRVYATSDNHSPQLGDPFLLSSQNRSVRIDVFLMSGTMVTGQVVDNRGRPVPEAQVICIPSYGQLVRAVDVPQAFRDTTADAEGFFEISELPAGSYQIIGRKKGYKFQTTGQAIYPDGYDDIGGVRVELQPVDEGEHAIFGIVTDSAQLPIDSVNIMLRGMGGESLDTLERETSTDASGNFRFDGIEAGMYSLQVEKEGFGRTSVPRALVDKETKVVLEATGLLAGRVLVRETQQPTGGAFTISATALSSSGGTALFRSSDEYQGIPFNAEDGRFELNLPAGEWQIEARADEYTPGRTPVTLMPGDVVDDVVVYISTEGGRIAGVVRTNDGESPTGATVQLAELGSIAGAVTAGGPGGAGGERVQRVGEDGAFAFEQLPEGSYNVIAQHANYANANSGVFFLAAEESREDLVIRLGSGGVLEGTVFRSGNPESGALLLIVSPESGTSTTATTDESGNYYADGLAGGTYEVTVTYPGGGNLGNIMDRQGGSVEVIEGQVTRRDFGVGGVLVTGTCIPGPNSVFGGEIFLRVPGPTIVPVGESVSVEDLSNLSSISHSNVGFGGRFEIEGVSPGVYQVEVYYFINFIGGEEIRNVYAGIVEVPDVPTIEVPIQTQLF